MASTPGLARKRNTGIFLKNRYHGAADRRAIKLAITAQLVPNTSCYAGRDLFRRVATADLHRF